MDVREALLKSRSYRRFHQDIRIPEKDLLVIADAARLSPSGRNIQALKFYLSNKEDINNLIFPTLAWAGYLTDWAGPAEGERPSAYIIQLLDTGIAAGTLCEEGITAQSMLLQAVELGYGGCIIGAVKRDVLRKSLGLPDRLRILNVIALGKPAEKIVLEDMRDGQFKYWRDADGTHHVPKRSIEELVIIP
ncbi:MAG TPA: nitroreductase family protein [Candidatus Coprenecus stercoravium]|uniref:Nitroreductase family protein n=1 Tax=Candidatus Coprenecus stercoravium TaxID=2840735 RepID=A0A9D2K8S5_9BACT|nr:nitroreductase family protein [Candidatus Coprenecus stercoravium]